MPEIRKNHGVGLIFRCKPCGFRTSGNIIYNDKKEPIRRCPRCHTILVWCATCAKYHTGVEDSETGVVSCSVCLGVIESQDYIFWNNNKEKKTNE